MTTICSEGYSAQCAYGSIALIKNAINNNKLPKRLGHFSFVCLELIVAPFSITKRVFTLALNILNILTIPFITNKLKRLANSACHIIILDPLNILSRIIVITMRVSVSVLGIISQKAAAYVVCASEWVELSNFIMRYIVDSKTLKPGSKITVKTMNPFTAISYLGQNEALTQYRSLKGITKESLDKSESEIRENFATSFKTLLNLNSQVIAKLRNDKTVVLAKAFLDTGKSNPNWDDLSNSGSGFSTENVRKLHKELTAFFAIETGLAQKEVHDIMSRGATVDPGENPYYLFNAFQETLVDIEKRLNQTLSFGIVNVHN